MFYNYLKILWRTIRRNKLYAFINTTGLVLGLSSCVFIFLYVQNEMSYDNFHDDVYVLSQGESKVSANLSTPYPLGGVLQRNVPAVNHATVVPYSSSGSIWIDETQYEIDPLLYADSSFFQVFNFTLLQGAPDEVLDAPNAVIFTKSSALKYFQTEDIVGKTVWLKSGSDRIPLQVTGLMKDVPANSSLQFECLISIESHQSWQHNRDSWSASMYQTFVRVSGREQAHNLEPRLSEIVAAHTERSAKHYFLTSMDKFYLSDLSYHTGFTGNKKYVFVFSLLAATILIIASFNYVNLATAWGLKRLQDIGIRKTIGANRFIVVQQYLFESMAFVVFAIIISLTLVYITMPVFNDLLGTQLILLDAIHWVNILILVAFTILLGLLSGAYPALYLSRLSPTGILKGSQTGQLRGSGLRKGLIVLQFALSLAFIIGSIGMQQQLKYSLNKDMGFQKDQLLTIPLTQGSSKQAQILKQEVLQYISVRNASLSNAVPTRYNLRLSLLKPPPNESDFITFHVAAVDYSYLETFQFDLRAGRFFSEQHGTDAKESVILNEAAIQELGWTPEESIGKQIGVTGGEKQIVGVLENFHFSTTHEPIKPVLFELKTANSQNWRYLTLRLQSDEIHASLADIREMWSQVVPGSIFEYFFIDEQFAALYQRDRQYSKLVDTVAFITILIAILGMYGLSTLAIQRRWNEIGIRRILGASALRIISLLNADYLKLVLAGFIVAIPAAWYFLNAWLQEFAYRIDLTAWPFISAGAAGFLMAVFVVSSQALRAAHMNPANTLRHE
jgi:putative ABC transport system permease protein